MDVRPLLRSQRKGYDDRRRHQGPASATVATTGGGGTQVPLADSGDQQLGGSRDLSAGGWMAGGSEVGRSVPGGVMGGAASFDIDEMLSWAKEHPQSVI